jgi:hypothetical protein
MILRICSSLTFWARVQTATAGMDPSIKFLLVKVQIKRIRELISFHFANRKEVYLKLKINKCKFKIFKKVFSRIKAGIVVSLLGHRVIKVIVFYLSSRDVILDTLLPSWVASPTPSPTAKTQKKTLPHPYVAACSLNTTLIQNLPFLKATTTLAKTLEKS